MTACTPVFLVCIAILYAITYITGWSYVEASVYINIYFQGFILAASSLFVLFGVLKKSKKNWPAKIVAVIYVLANFMLYVFLLRHYGFNPSIAFDKCYNELMELSHMVDRTYELIGYPLDNLIPAFIAENLSSPTYMIINVLIFVVCFLIVVLVNFYVGKKVYLSRIRV